MRTDGRMVRGRLTSEFRPDTSATFSLPPIVRTQNITFRRVICTIDASDGSPTLKETQETESGVLDVQPMVLSGQYRGKSKDIYPVRVLVVTIITPDL